MKNVYSVVGAMLATSAMAFASWTTVVPGAGSDLNAIAFASNNLGMAVGNDGAVLRTLDGGASWQPMPMLQNFNLRDVSFPSPGHVVAVGEKQWGIGAVVVSYDSGASWFVPLMTLPEVISSVCFVSPSVGYATAHGYVLHTNDGGLTWDSMNIAGGNFLTSVRFTDPMHGVVTGGMHDQLGFTMRTNDGGKTWTADHDQYIEPISTVRTLDATHAWRVGGDFEYGAFISATNDGGATWSETVLPDTKLSLNDIYFTDATHGIAVGGVYLLETNDGGAHWSRTTLLDNGYMNALTRDAQGTVWGVGSGGRIMKEDASPNGVPVGVPAASFTLLPNYPNPVSSSTEFHFAIPARGDATLAVYAMDGSLVGTIVNGILDAGDHIATWNAVNAAGNALPSGTYLVKLRAGENTISRSVTVVR